MNIKIYYKKIIPNFINNIYDTNKNKYYYILFTKKIYNYLLYLSYNDIYIWSNNEKLTKICNNDKFDIIKYDNKISYLLSYNYKNNYPQIIIINNKNIIAKLIDHNSLISKMNNKRYLCFIINIIYINKIMEHICNLIFDNYYNECYIIEIDGIINKKIHKIMQYYVSSKGYKYIILENEGIVLNINNKIKSSKQKEFFNGYCMGWGLYFKYLAEKADINFEMKKYLKNISFYKNKGPLNELIEIFQVWFYKNK